MAKEIAGTREYLMGRNVYIYRPQNSPDKWWISYKLDGIPRRHESLKETDKNAAIMKADNYYEERKRRFERRGIEGLKTEATMRACYDHWFKNQDAPGYGTSRERRRLIRSHWERFHLPYFGPDSEVSEHFPTQEKLLGYKEWRRKVYKSPSGGRGKMGKTTHAMEALSLHQVWRKAKLAGVITGYPKMPTDPIKQAVKDRGKSVEFQVEEIPKLISNFEEYCEPIPRNIPEDASERKRRLANRKRGKYQDLLCGYSDVFTIGKERMFAFAMIALATSARPAAISHLKWKDITQVKENGKTTYRFKFTHSKIGVQYTCVPWGFNIDIGQVLKRWERTAPSRVRKDYKNERLFDVRYKDGKGIRFTNYSLVFRRFLKHYKMLTHEDKSLSRKSRGTYSLRSTAIRHRLNDGGFPVAMVAQQANTSIQMINAHYYDNKPKVVEAFINQLPEEKDLAEVIELKKGSKAG